jgi:hypothetical protein
MMKRGVATPSVASKNIAVVIAIPATNPASNPEKIAFVLLTRYRSYSGVSESQAL